MNNTIQRLLLFFVAVPLLALAVVFLPYAHYAALVVLVIMFCVGSSLELARLFESAGIKASKPAFVMAGSSAPLAFYLSTFLDASYYPLLLALAVLAVMAFFAAYAFSSKDNLPRALPGAAALSLAFLYPGLLGGFVVLIAAGQPQAMASILSFALIVVANDSLAWLVGVTIGKRRNIVAVSPNKSLAGFVGGMMGSILCSVAMKLLFPAAFPVPLWLVVLLGAVMGMAVIIGDLFESALKRSAGIKDSGSGVPGRGGFLDSFDSELFAAPVFYAAIVALGLFQ